MLDGKYSASINSPMGAINGMIYLVSKGNDVEGTIETMGMKNTFKGIKTQQNAAKFHRKL